MDNYTAGITNAGVVSAAGFDVAWHVGAENGEKTGRSIIGSLVPRETYEATCVWGVDAEAYQDEHAIVFAVADYTCAVVEFDEDNNVHSAIVTRRP